MSIASQSTPCPVYRVVSMDYNTDLILIRNQQSNYHYSNKLHIISKGIRDILRKIWFLNTGLLHFKNMQHKYKCVPKRSWLQNFGLKIRTKTGGYGAKFYHKHDLGTLDPAGLVLERKIKNTLRSRPVKRWYSPQNQHFFLGPPFTSICQSSFTLMLNTCTSL